MDEKILVAIIGVTGGAGGGWIAAFIQTRLAFRTKLDEDLLAARREAYKELWSLTAVVPAWPRDKDLTFARLESLSKDLRKWYFDDGGILLSEEARSAYGKAQCELTGLIEKNNPGAAVDGGERKQPLPGERDRSSYGKAQSALSSLRTELTRDLLSRTRSGWFGEFRRMLEQWEGSS
jgi:hypothetical protein